MSAARVLPAVRAGARELLGLVLPVACAGCGADDEVWCSPCRAAFGPPRRCEDGAGRLDLLDGRPTLPVWALAVGDGHVREAVVAWKDRGRADLAGPFAALLAGAAVDLAPALGTALAHAPPLVVVAVPSTRVAVRRRGADLVDDLARAVARALREAGVPARHERALRRRRGRDQVGLGARARQANLRGAVVLRRSAPARLVGRPVLLVDDIVTTGASLAVSRAALAPVAPVVGALVLAATPSGAGAAGSPSAGWHVLVEGATGRG